MGVVGAGEALRLLIKSFEGFSISILPSSEAIFAAAVNNGRCQTDRKETCLQLR